MAATREPAHAQGATATTHPMTRSASGRMRRPRRAQNAPSDTRPTRSRWPQQDTGDDEAGHDEEGVDAQKPTARPPDGVEADDGQHGESAETLDVRTAVAGCVHPGRRGGCCGGHDAQDRIGAGLR